MKIAIAQVNPIIGDIAANVCKVREFMARGAEAGADIVCFPELTVIGYPPKDLLLKPSFIADNLQAVSALEKDIGDVAAVIGYVDRDSETGALYNAAAMIQHGKIVAVKFKTLLPTYDVFDEARYFTPGPPVAVAELLGTKVGLSICEDVWTQAERDGAPHPRYDSNPVAEMVKAGAEIILNISASPFEIGKHDVRRRLIRSQAQKHRRPIVYVNQVGGNDELIFDGASFAVDSSGRVIHQCRDFEEDLAVVEVPAQGPPPEQVYEVATGIESIYRGLCLGLRDYVGKCGFAKAVLGLSGGIDSAVTACIAVDALGAENVTAVAMPGPYSSPGSLTDAQAVAKNLGIRCITVPITEAFEAYKKSLAEAFTDCEADTTEENIQARIRGNILMALSNKFGCMVLSTGNKSELAVGYCTLYGDMAGGLAVISDVPKTLVYKLADCINANCGGPIVRSIIEKPPSAELKPDQTDQDTLPPYDLLDRILELYIHDQKSADEILGELWGQSKPASRAAASADVQTVARVISMVDRNEYKRQQAAPGLKVTSRAFGFGRRMPIAQRYNHSK